MAEAALDLQTDDVADDAPIAEQTTEQTQATTQPTHPLAAADTPEPDKPVTPTFPEDWREQMAGGDEKLLKELSRFTSPQMLVKSWKDTRTKISSGQYKTALPDNATPEEVAQWRTENGVPESWEKYDRDLGDGMVLGEEDAPIVDNFLQKMHEANMPASTAKEVLKWYYEFNDQQEAERQSFVREFTIDSSAQLRSEWGADYQGNLNAMRAFVPEDVSDILFSAFTPEGEPIGSHPVVLRWLAQEAREKNPTSTLIPSTSTNNLQTIEQELNEIRKELANPASNYWKDEKKQLRFQQLLEARDKLSSR
jgi:hypothetical protein